MIGIICEKCGKEYKYSHQCEYKCVCGKIFDNSQSYVAHTGRCKLFQGDNYRELGFCSEDKRHRLSNDDRVKGGITRRVNLQEVFTGKKKMQSNSLKYRLVDEGYKEWKCECCGNVGWLGDSIPLELHHKDGDSSNNELSNLELLCPNCHSLTDNYRWKKKFKKT